MSKQVTKYTDKVVNELWRYFQIWKTAPFENETVFALVEITVDVEAFIAVEY